MGSLLVGVCIALAIGLSVGRIQERAKRARTDYAKTKLLVSGMRKTAWRSTIVALRAAVLVGFALVVVFAAMFHVGSR